MRLAFRVFWWQAAPVRSVFFRDSGLSRGSCSAWFKIRWVVAARLADASLANYIACRTRIAAHLGLAVRRDRQRRCGVFPTNKILAEWSSSSSPGSCPGGRTCNSCLRNHALEVRLGRRRRL